jgi:hypothetical protein
MAGEALLAPRPAYHPPRSAAMANGDSTSTIVDRQPKILRDLGKEIAAHLERAHRREEKAKQH